MRLHRYTRLLISCRQRTTNVYYVVRDASFRAATIWKDEHRTNSGVVQIFKFFTKIIPAENIDNDVSGSRYQVKMYRQYLMNMQWFNINKAC